MSESTGLGSARVLRLSIVTELTDGQDEGMANWTRTLEAGIRTWGDVEVSRLQLPLNDRAAALMPKTLRLLSRANPDVVLYAPYSGLTIGALVRMRWLKLAVPRAKACLVVLQAGAHDLRVPRCLRCDGALFGSELLRERYGSLALRSTVLPPAIDLDRFVPATESRSVLRGRLGLPDHATVLHVGHLTPNRNLGVLAQIARETDLSVVVCASTSTDPDPAVASELEAAGVTVLRRFLPRIQELYQAADLYVFPVTEPRGCSHVPLSVFEALACGCPVLTTTFGCLPEVLGEGPSVRFADPRQMPGIVQSLISQPSARDQVETLDVRSQGAAATRFFRGLTASSGRARMVVLTGIDGSGKSTQARLLAEWASQRGLRAAVIWGRWDPMLARPATWALGALTSLRRRKRSRSRGAREQGGSSSRERLAVKRRLLRYRSVAVAWDALMVIDYGLRTALRVRRALREVDLLILDRYWHDVLADRWAGGEPGTPPRILQLLLPSPDGVALIDVPDELAFQRRKGDVADIEYLADRRMLYEEMMRADLMRRIDGSGGPSEVHDRLVSFVREVTGL